MVKTIRNPKPRYDPLKIKGHFVIRGVFSHIFPPSNAYVVSMNFNGFGTFGGIGLTKIREMYRKYRVIKKKGYL